MSVESLKKQTTTLRKEIIEEMTNGWSQHERTHLSDYLKEEVEPHFPTLYKFLTSNTLFLPSLKQIADLKDEVEVYRDWTAEVITKNWKLEGRLSAIQKRSKKLHESFVAMKEQIRSQGYTVAVSGMLDSLDKQLEKLAVLLKEEVGEEQ